MTPSGDGDGVVVRPAGEQGATVPGSGLLGMAWFIASLSVLFAASLVAYAIVRLRADSWQPPGQDGFPWGLCTSTAILAACSLSIHRAMSAIRKGDQVRLQRRLRRTLLLATVFLASQSWNWLELHRTDLLQRHSLYAFTFYMLTGLHALHVVGGWISLAWVNLRARRGAYTWAYYPGVRYNVIYWHFLGIVWLTIFVLLAMT